MKIFWRGSGILPEVDCPNSGEGRCAAVGYRADRNNNLIEVVWIAVWHPIFFGKSRYFVEFGKNVARAKFDSFAAAKTYAIEYFQKEGTNE